MIINRPTPIWRPKPERRTALAAKLINQADILERTRTSLAALWWEREDAYERAFLDAMSHSFGLYAEDLCLEAAALLGKSGPCRTPRHVDRSGLVVRVNNIELLLSLLEHGYSELCEDALMGSLSSEQCQEFQDIRAAFETLFCRERPDVVFTDRPGIMPLNVYEEGYRYSNDSR